MDLHLYPTTLSRDRALRETTRARGLLFDHHYFTHVELSERLFRSEGLPGRLIEPATQTVFVRHSLTASLGEAPSPGLVVEYRGVIGELKGVGLGVEDFAAGIDLLDPTVSPTTRQALHRLLEVWRCYQSCLAQAGLVDRGDQNTAHCRARCLPSLPGALRSGVLAHQAGR